MRHIVVACLSALILSAVPVAAQTPPAAPAAAPQKPGEIRAACREEARGKGLKGQPLREAVDECFKAKRPTTPAAAPAAAPGLTKDGQPKAADVRSGCREEAKTKGLKGQALRDSVDQCFRAKRPDLAKAADCRKEAKAKNLEGKDRNAFMKTCRAA